MDQLNLGFWSLLPPVLTIVLALKFKDVIFALVAGIFSGMLLLTGGNVATAAVKMTDRIATSLSDGWNIRIFLFCALLGSLVAILARTGAARAFGEWAAQRLKTRRSTLIFTFVFGIVIFIDDYFNALSIGTAMRPVCDRMKIARAKLAYILDSTAAPVCIMAPVSSWVVTVMSYVRNSDGFTQLKISEFDFFLMMIPYNLYAILALLLVVLVVSLNWNFGPMRRAEMRAEAGLGFIDEARYGDAPADIAETTGSRARPIDMLFPLGVLIVFAVASFPLTAYYRAIDGKTVQNLPMAMRTISLTDAFRQTEVSYALFYTIIATLAVVSAYCLVRRLLVLRELSEAVITGIRSMVPALLILVLAWTIGSVIKSPPADGGVGLSNYLAQLVVDGHFPYWVLPIAVFFLSCFIAFSTGTSWGCMAIMIPITMPIAVAGAAQLYAADLPQQLNAVLLVVGASIGGAIFGDHASPISDTTILSATGAGCPCLEHVATQLPYAAFAAVCAGFGYLVGGLTQSIVWSAATALAFFVAGLLVLPKLQRRNFTP